MNTQRWKLLLGAVLCLLGCMSGGCAVLGVLGHMISPPRVDPVYVLDKKVPLLVMAENRRNPGMLVPEAEELAVYLRNDLESRGVVTAVPPEKLQALLDRDPRAARSMSISALGKAVGAHQVLYVDIVSLQASNVAGMPTTGSMELLVHVVDTETGKTLWPTNSYQVQYETRSERDIESDRERGLRSKLLQGAAHRVARLFYKWDPAAEED